MSRASQTAPFGPRAAVAGARGAGGSRFAGCWLIAMACLACLAGCSNDTIQHSYGQRRGRTGGPSVNGTAVLSQMFKQAGHPVHTRRSLSPKAESYDTIVWAPDDFAAPSDEAVQFLEDWLSNKPGRTLIYIGRDYDAEITYWESVLPNVPPEQAAEVTRRLAQARARHAQARAATPDDKCSWFAIETDLPRRRIGRLGDPADTLRGSWCEGKGIDVSQLDIVIETRLVPQKERPANSLGDRYQSEVQLAAGRDILVRRVTNPSWPNGQVIIVTNGSFLLNLPLVEKGHRQLAAKLIEQCQPGGRTMFLESGPAGVPIFAWDSEKKYPTGLEAFTQWPIGFILMHFVALGLVVLMSKVAIFGRPLELEPAATSDFGRHVASLGEALAKTRDEAYARRLLAEFRDSSPRRE